MDLTVHNGNNFIVTKGWNTMKKRIVTTMLAAGMIASTLGGTAMQVLAADTTTNVTYETIDSAATPMPTTSECLVTIDGGDSSFTVAVPKTIEGAGASGTLLYDVTVGGDIAGNEYVSVVPDESVTLKQTKKADVVATIAQDKKEWHVDEFDTVGKGEITYDGIKAGTYKGTFTFNIDLKTDAPAEAAN